MEKTIEQLQQEVSRLQVEKDLHHNNALQLCWFISQFVQNIGFFNLTEAEAKKYESVFKNGFNLTGLMMNPMLLTDIFSKINLGAITELFSNPENEAMLKNILATYTAELQEKSENEAINKALAKV